MDNLANNVLEFDLAEHNGTDVIQALNVFNITVNGQSLSITFLPTDTALDIDNVTSQINLQFSGLASNSSGSVKLTSNMSGSNSTILIGSAGANQVLGFTSGYQANGTDSDYAFLGVSKSTAYSGESISMWANWTDDIGLGSIWLIKSTSSQPVNITSQSGTNYFANLSATFSESDIGDLTLTLYANDSYGNSNHTVSLSITVLDNTTGTVNITTPHNGSTVSNSYFTLAWDVWEGSPASSAFCRYNMSGSAGSETGTKTSSQYSSLSGVKYSFTQSLSELTDGLYNLTVTCTDSDNVNYSQAYIFRINDTTVPGVTASSSVSGTSTTKTAEVTVTTTEKATCKYDLDDSSYALMGDTMTGSGTTSHSFSKSYSSDQTVTYYIRCMDTAGNAMNTSESVTYVIDVVSSSAGGGSSGGASTGGDQIGASTSVVWAGVAANTKLQMPVDDVDIPVTLLKVTVKDEISQLELDVSELTSKPSSPSELPRKAYKYLKIDATGLSDDQIKEAKVRFRVEKSWFAETGFDFNDIVLSRWHNSAWNELSTHMTSQDGSYVYYEADVPGFSYFAITVKSDANEPGAESESETAAESEQGVPEAEATPAEPEEAPPSEPSQKEKTTTEQKQRSEQKEKAATSWSWIFFWLLLIIVVFVILLVFLPKGGEGNILGRLKRGLSFTSKPSGPKTGRNNNKRDAGISSDSSEELESYIRQSLKSGRNKAEIKEILLDAGWKEPEFKDILNKV